MSLKRWDECAKRLPADRDTVAVEVGVWKGQMSEKLLTLCPRLTLYLVDLWLAGEENVSWLRTGSKMAAQPAAAVEQVRLGVEALAVRHHPRARIIREHSASAARQIEDGSLDLVFIDADHSQLAVQADIQAWRPKVKAGGWIGGHDFGSPRFPGVASAVFLSFRREQVVRGENATWWVRM